MRASVLSNSVPSPLVSHLLCARAALAFRNGYLKKCCSKSLFILRCLCPSLIQETLHFLHEIDHSKALESRTTEEEESVEGSGARASEREKGT